MLARARTFAVNGVDAVEVAVEADVGSGLPAFTIVGLPDTAVQESRERVRSALVNSGFEFPLRRMTVNLAPAYLRKVGPGFDLALAAAVLAASGQVPSERLEAYGLCGELGLDGSVRPVRGALAIADAARARRCDGLLVSRDNESEAGLVENLNVHGIAALSDAVRFLRGDGLPASRRVDAAALLRESSRTDLDLGQIRGHAAAKRALEVAAAGRHNLLMIGAPGSGKSMLARRLPTILPPLDLERALETTRVHSVAGLLGDRPLVAHPPFRAPHHSISVAGLVGGGPGPSAGEVSLAQNGVLFLDELSEFARPALESLRQPLEDGFVTITRASRSARFPSRCMLVGASNPCPCGFAGSTRRECLCPPAALARHAGKLSGPLLDRIDIVLRVEPPAVKDLDRMESGAESTAARQRVVDARRHRAARQHGASADTLDQDARNLLREAYERIGLSMRGRDRALQVARTIADLEQSESIARRHVSEALAYRDQRRVLASQS
jgi:magnesium chelatase family protein